MTHPVNPENSAGKNLFLDNGGEMGELIKAFDWSSTSIGPIENWPNSLATTLGIMLHSAFPMFLFWGDDLICFYNDAFRPSLGVNGKHPAIGKKGVEVWSEIWEQISPWINGVLKAGKAVYFEDQPVGFYRNGRMEDIYWTFSYSPVYGDGGMISGVFVTCHETTQSVMTIRKLEESEQRFRKMAEEADILIALSDESSRATFFNKRWEIFTGKSEAQLVDFDWAELIHEQDRDKIIQVYVDAFQKREPWIGEFRVLNSQGQYRWLLAKGTPRFSSDGTFTGFVSSSMDITDRKTADERFREGEHRLREIIENAPFPIGVYVGREMRIELVNQSILDVWGKGNDVVGKTYFEVLPELEEQMIYPQLDRVFTTGEPFHARNQRVDLAVEGKLQTFYFNYSFTPLYDTKGNIYGVMNTAADVTDVQLAKQKIEQSERNLRNIVLQAPVAMVIFTGPQHVIEVANDRVVEIWGKEKDEVIGRPVFDALPEARNQGLEELMRKVYDTGTTVVANERPVKLLRKGELQMRYLNFVYEPYRSGEGDVSGVLAVAIDVTDLVLARHKIEEIVAERTKALAIANENLEKSNAELAQFAYIASHDLQEPLRKIRTFAQLLEGSVADVMSDTARRYLDKIHAASERMHTLVKDVLAYSEIDKREDYQVVDLNVVLENVIADFELLIEQKGATIRVEKLPAISGIHSQMSQLFGNLISNALKFTKPDVSPVITVKASRVRESEFRNTDRDVEFYCIQVSDNGIGFKEEFAAQIFNIFQRLHRKDEFEGTGIGLAMCKRIALNHNGDINADGSGPWGAMFNVYLPVYKE